MWWALPLERNSFHFGKDGMSQNMTGQIKKVNETGNYRRTKMKKEMVLQKLREQGCRITQQRQILLDIILEEDCSSCKEIFYRASKLDPGIGTATVYRLVNKLEEIGAISRKNMYKFACDEENGSREVCRIEMEDHTVRYLSSKNWNEVILAGLKSCGYIGTQKVKAVVIESCV